MKIAKGWEDRLVMLLVLAAMFNINGGGYKGLAFCGVWLLFTIYCQLHIMNNSK